MKLTEFCKNVWNTKNRHFYSIDSVRHCWENLDNSRKEELEAFAENLINSFKEYQDKELSKNFRYKYSDSL